MKKIIVIVLFPFTLMFSQAEFVTSEHPVYEFLQRMNSRHIIKGYNNFDLPKSRKEIANWLKIVTGNENTLDKTDKKIWGDLISEFEYDIFNTLDNSIRLIGGDEYDLFSQKEKYLYFFEEKNKASIFINILGEGEGILTDKDGNTGSNSTSLGLIGGEIRGSFLNKFSFHLKGTNGNVFGNKQVALVKPVLRYNFKLNEKPEETFFDDTEGYFAADFDIVRFKIGRDRLLKGYGITKSLISANSPKFDYIYMDINYAFLSFSYFHGKLLGEESFAPDSITRGSVIITEKYLGYHRLGFNISDYTSFGLGEMIVYGDRPPDFSYINPFNFYKSIEHSNRDRDNAMLFLDFHNNSVKGLELYGILLIDDIAFGKIGSGWWGNQTMLNLGLFSSNLYHILPLEFNLEYLRIEPYTFSHRLSRNNYTNYSYGIGPGLQPNSSLISAKINYRINYRLKVSGGFSYSVHGANPVNPDGSVVNVGGDINLGHRSFDSENVSFLEGDLEYNRTYSAELFYEPVNQMLIRLKTEYSVNMMRNSVEEKKIIAYLIMSLRL